MQNIPIDILKFKKFNVESIKTLSEYCEIISSTVEPRIPLFNNSCHVSFFLTRLENLFAYLNAILSDI